MLTYLFTQKYYDCLSNYELMQQVEDNLTDALIQSDFGESEVEMRFADMSLYKQAIGMFGMIAQRMDYIYRFNRENEIIVRGENIYQACRYLFMNSIPENDNGS